MWALEPKHNVEARLDKVLDENARYMKETSREIWAL
jgi:hypothetical protein